MATAVDSAPVVPLPQPPAGVVIPRTQSTSLYVGDLVPDVNEAVLYEIFSPVGPVASIRVCRDAVTRRSLGYAYVNFQLPADAERALDTLNFSAILGRVCRIMWCQRDPTMRRSGVGNIFVKGLEKSIDHKELSDAFSLFGNILSCKVVYDEKGESAGRGFVHFETAAAAEAAIAEANGTLLKDKKITVAHFKSKKERMDEYARTEHQFRNVFIKNLPENFGDDDLHRTFSAFGPVTSHIVMRDVTTGASRCFGFCNFAEPAHAKAAVDALNNTAIENKTVFVGRAMKKGERRAILSQEHDRQRRERQEQSRGVNLYVKNLSEGVTDERLRTLFTEFGAIASAKVMRDQSGAERGFGFVCFTDPADATRAITEMNGRLTEGKPLYVALAQPRDERRQALAAQHRQRLMAQRSAGMMPFAPQGMYPPMMYGNPYQRGGFGQMPYGGRFGGNMPQRFPVQGPFMPQQAYYQQQGRFPGQGQPAQFRQNRPPYPRGAQPQQGRGPRQQQPNGNPRFNGQPPRGAPQGLPVDPQQVPAGNSMQQLASLVASADPDRQKQILGDNLYQIISAIYPQQAGKLTGMLLQMDNADLLHLIEDSNALRAEVDKANEVLAQHSGSA